MTATTLRGRKGPTPSRGRRHPVTVMHQARQLHDEGLTDPEIVSFLAGQGITVQRTTIARWTRPAYAENARKHHDRAEGRASRRRGMTRGLIPPAARPEFNDGRIEALANLGFTDEAIAVLMTFDADRPYTTADVRRVLDGCAIPLQDPTRDVNQAPDAQRDAALRVANRVRKDAALVKHGLRDRSLSLEDALTDPRADPIRVSVLLKCLPGWGPTRAGRALEAAKIEGGELVGSLGEWSRSRLLRAAATIPAQGLRERQAA